MENKKEPDYEREKSYYVVIPTWFWDKEEVPWKMKKLYGRIVSLVKKNGYCFASDQYLADEAQVGLRTSQRYLKELETMELIKRDTASQKGGGWDRKIYLTKPPMVADQTATVVPSDGGANRQSQEQSGGIIESINSESLGPEQILSFYLKRENQKGEKLDTIQAKTFQIIAFYWVLSNQKITNNEQWKNFVKRNIKIAQDIVKQEFSPDDLLEASSLLRAKKLSWTLETLASWIPKLKQETENLKPDQKVTLKHYMGETFNLIQDIILDHGSKTTTKK